LSILVSLALGCGVVGCESEKSKSTEQNRSLAGKSVVMIIAGKDFRDEEYFKPREVLEKAGAHVIVASSSLEEATGMLGGQVVPDIRYTDVNPDSFDAIVFVGGTGSAVYWNDLTAHRLAQAAYEKGKVVGAICIAPVTLANAGILKGKKATVSWTAADRLKIAGATNTDRAVEVDGNIVTASGPEAAQRFGEAIRKALSEGSG
jgi:protease I